MRARTQELILRSFLANGVAVIGHSLARLFQPFKSLAHLGFAFCWPRVLIGAEGIAAIVFLWPRRARAQYANGHRESCGISILPLSEFQKRRREAMRARDNVVRASDDGCRLHSPPAHSCARGDSTMFLLCSRFAASIQGDMANDASEIRGHFQ